MSNIMEMVTSLKEVFTKYARKSGNKNTLNKRELAEMLHKEVPGAEDMSKGDIKMFFDMLDEDGNGQVDFKEFVNSLADLSEIVSSFLA